MVGAIEMIRDWMSRKVVYSSFMVKVSDWNPDTGTPVTQHRNLISFGAREIKMVRHDAIHINL